MLTQEELSRHAGGAQCEGLRCTPLSYQGSWGRRGGLPGVQQHRSLAWGAPGPLQAGYLLRATGPAVSGKEGLLESVGLWGPGPSRLSAGQAPTLQVP